MTSEEAEKQSKTSIDIYYKTMYINVVFGIITIILSYFTNQILLTIVGVLWIIIPYNTENSSIGIDILVGGATCKEQM